tara:strand:+ start:439 stop:666 length:228 start_codon:yes stop_codon:yes gene_type:complete
MENIYKQPDGDIIYQDRNYIYYTDQVWSLERLRLITLQYYTKNNRYKCYINNPDRSRRFAYVIGSGIPDYGDNKE